MKFCDTSHLCKFSSRKGAGRLFQTFYPPAAKLLLPNVLCVRGTAHDLFVDERNRLLGPPEKSGFKDVSGSPSSVLWRDCLVFVIIFV